MDGEIGVESAEGNGSTFWFTITLPSAGKPQGQRMAPIDVTGARVLIVDDNAVNRAILSEQMDSWTFDSCAAESGPEGIGVLQAAADFGVAVDCVILDYQMPGMTGADVARIIRSTPAIAATPIVMLTSVDQSLSNSSLSRSRHRSAADQAGPLIGASRNAGDDDPEASPAQDDEQHRGQSLARREPRPMAEPSAPPLAARPGRRDAGVCGRQPSARYPCRRGQ